MGGSKPQNFLWVWVGIFVRQLKKKQTNHRRKIYPINTFFFALLEHHKCHGRALGCRAALEGAGVTPWVSSPKLSTALEWHRKTWESNRALILGRI